MHKYVKRTILGGVGVLGLSVYLAVHSMREQSRPAISARSSPEIVYDGRVISLPDFIGDIPVSGNVVFDITVREGDEVFTYYREFDPRVLGYRKFEGNLEGRADGSDNVSESDRD